MSVVAQALKKGVIILIIFNDVYLNLYLISPCHFRMFGSDTTSEIENEFFDDIINVTNKIFLRLFSE